MARRRPAAHFLDLDQIAHLTETAWDLADTAARLGLHTRPTYANALKVQTQIATGLRVAELHNLHPTDLHDNGTLTVRRGKGWKPRKSVFLDGGAASPTLALLRDFIAGNGRPRGNNKTTANPCRPEERIFTSGVHAYSHWIVHRLGPASGLQRRIDVLVPGSNAPPPRYLIRTHLFRACFVILGRRLPRRHNREPIAWETLAYWLGHESPDMTKTRYWYADEDEMLDELATAIPNGAMASPRAFTTWSTT